MVLRDTGCRSDNKVKQPCAPASWLFAQISAAAEEVQRDGVVHVGDYNYLVDPCAEGCNSHSASSDIWAAWEYSFFAPATSTSHMPCQTLCIALRSMFCQPMSNSPLHFLDFVRGNHETCSTLGSAMGPG